MKSLILGKFKMITLIIIAGMLFLMTISGCKSTEVIFKTGSDTKVAKQGPSLPPQNGPPPWAPAHGHRAKYRYYYYPDPQVFYNENHGCYFYYSNGNWQVSVSLPDRIKINVNDYVILVMDTDQPYQYHTEVAKKYPPGQAKKVKNKGKGKDKWL